jgi:hypothetical protein
VTYGDESHEHEAQISSQAKCGEKGAGMSKNLEMVIQRAISDAAFRRQLQSDPEAALRGFKLTDGEVAALRSGDAGKLTSLGIDQRMSKTFTFGADDLASRVSPGGDLTSAGMAHTDQDVRLNSAVTPGGAGTGGTSSSIEPENTFSAGQVAPGIGSAARIGDPMSPGLAASNIGDPDNPAVPRGYVGEQVTNSGLAAPIEGTPEEFSFRDQGASTISASNTADPANPAFVRGFIGDQSDAFLSEGEVSQLSADRSWEQAEDRSHAFNPDSAEAVVHEGDTTVVRHEPDVPS